MFRRILEFVVLVHTVLICIAFTKRVFERLEEYTIDKKALAIEWIISVSSFVVSAFIMFS